MRQRLSGKTAIITGGGSGIGRAVATLFAREGARVAVLDINQDDARQTADEILKFGGNARSYLVDISLSESVREVVKAVVSDFGEVTTLVNVAGIFDGNAQLHNTDEELWDRILAVDLKGIFLMSQAALPLLQASGNGAIVNFASVAGKLAHSGGLAYTAAKHGVVGLTKSIAADYGPEVRCNAVLPGLVRSPMTEYLFTEDEIGKSILARDLDLPSGRAAEPEELANAALFLASDEASFVYGAQLTVDGGRTIK